MKLKNILLVVSIVVIVGVIAFILITQKQRTSGPDPLLETQGENIGYEVGQIAPDFELSSKDGGVMKLSDFRGQAVMIDFWADWCPFCTKEFPELQKVYEKYRSQGFVILGVHRTSTETVGTANKFVEDMGATFPILYDTTDKVYKAYSPVQAMPTSIFIDGDGVIVERVLGPKDLGRLENLILRTLN